MRKILISLFVIILLASISILAQAQEDAKYNFGSAQADKELKINPGGEITTKLYFYNIYGNRITHIKLEVSESPENWIISLTPDAHDTEVDVSGVLTTVNENLYVEISEAVDEIPENVPEGIEYISSSVGYIGANPVEIKIKVPENENYGSYNLRIDASAFWLGQQGTAEIQQSRSFEYKIDLVSEIFYEKPVTKDGEIKVKNETPIAPEEEGLVGITGGFLGGGTKAITTGILALTTIILLIVFLFLVSVAKKQKIKKNK